jgi:hypothetical protein
MQEQKPGQKSGSMLTPGCSGLARFGNGRPILHLSGLWGYDAAGMPFLKKAREVVVVAVAPQQVCAGRHGLAEERFALSLLPTE